MRDEGAKNSFHQPISPNEAFYIFMAAPRIKQKIGKSILSIHLFFFYPIAKHRYKIRDRNLIPGRTIKVNIVHFMYKRCMSRPRRDSHSLDGLGAGGEIYFATGMHYKTVGKLLGNGQNILCFFLCVVFDVLTLICVGPHRLLSRWNF